MKIITGTAEWLSHNPLNLVNLARNKVGCPMSGKGIHSVDPELRLNSTFLAKFNKFSNACQCMDLVIV